MDLRSAHKASEKPPARLRLSLTRSLDTGPGSCGEQGGARGGGLYRRLARRKNKQRVSRFLRLAPPPQPPTPTQDPPDEDWGVREEEEEEEEGVEVEEEEEPGQEAERVPDMHKDTRTGKRLIVRQHVSSSLTSWPSSLLSVVL